MKLSNKAVRSGMGEECPKCQNQMERRKHPAHWVNRKSYYYTEWDYCRKCHHVQHYEKFKSSEWHEQDRQISFLRSI